ESWLPAGRGAAPGFGEHKPAGDSELHAAVGEIDDSGGEGGVRDLHARREHDAGGEPDGAAERGVRTEGGGGLAAGEGAGAWGRRVGAGAGDGGGVSADCAGVSGGGAGIDGGPLVPAGVRVRVRGLGERGVRPGDGGAGDHGGRETTGAAVRGLWNR